MALKTVEKKKEAPPTQPADNGVLLELALYKLYTWQHTTYEAGKAYRFNRETAMQLLGEHDMGRPVWRIYRKVAPRVAPANQVTDATKVVASRASSLQDEITLPDESKRIDIGTDEEIADVLNKVEEHQDDITI